VCVCVCGGGGSEEEASLPEGDIASARAIVASEWSRREGGGGRGGC